ncbi:hypothetical protein SH528x_001953 [Novipirellula sp. SH528]|uniref:hypothetical protein n=1 Tax=Novipirellula sp. SH528 TaxID=3454466 RepID=UPI003FA04978
MQNDAEQQGDHSKCVEVVSSIESIRRIYCGSSFHSSNTLARESPSPQRRRKSISKTISSANRDWNGEWHWNGGLIIIILGTLWAFGVIWTR